MRGSPVSSLQMLVSLLAQMNSDSSRQNSELNACTLVKGGEYPITVGRLMALLQQIRLMLWILLMSHANIIVIISRSLHLFHMLIVILNYGWGMKFSDNQLKAINARRCGNKYFD